MALSIRWLGVAGFHIRTSGHSILIDPYFTRVPLRKMLIGKIKPDPALVQPRRFPADAIFVSHAHVDHLLDVPLIAREQGNPVYGSANTCRLLKILELPENQIHLISPDDQVQIGDIQLRVLPSAHIRIPVFRPGEINEHLHPPLRARQYVMDDDYCFQIRAGGLTILTDPGRVPDQPLPVDVLLLFPFHPPDLLEGILAATQPRWIIPSHWDDFLRPLSSPMKPMLQPPHREWPPIGRADLQKFTRRIEKTAPGVKVIQLSWFEEVELGI